MAGQSQELPAAAIEALRQGHKIGAIKILRQEWHLGLKEAKDAVDSYLEARPELAGQFQVASTGTKRLWMWLLVLLTATLLFYLVLHR